MSVPKSHPRYVSLKTREKIVKGIEKGITSIDGLIAHGRGEAFDYLIGEKTTKKAKQQIKKAAKILIKAKYPVISVNGNSAALCTNDLIKLSKLIPAKLEVNIFHTRKNQRFFVSQKSEGFFRTSKQREKNIKRFLLKKGAKEVLMPGSAKLKYLDHNRKYCNKNGIYKADVVFVPLEDGDRCQALRKMGKKVVTIDLNPLSRTAKSANINIVDNIIRAMPLLIKEIKKLKIK